MERTTWTRGGEKKCTNPVNWSLLQMVRSNFQVRFSPAKSSRQEEQGRDGLPAGQRFLWHVCAGEESFAIVLAVASAVIETLSSYWVAVQDVIPL